MRLVVAVLGRELLHLDVQWASPDDEDDQDDDPPRASLGFTAPERSDRAAPRP